MSTRNTLDWYQSNYYSPIVSSHILIRPPGTTVPDGLMFYPWCFFSFFRHAFSEIARPIALKLCHVIGIWLFFFINWLQKFRGCSPKKFGGQKHAKFRSILDHFRLWSRISPERGNMSKIGKTYELGKFLLRLRKKSGELCSTNSLELHVSLDPLKCTFWHTISRPLWVAAPWNFYTR